MKQSVRSLKNSRNLLRRAEGLIPSCTQTFSKGPTQFVQGVSPVFLQRGRGSHVWDVDGNEYIDYISALGAVVLGYGHPAVTKAVQRQLKEGVSFSLPHRLEVELAEDLCALIPCAEMVRFGKNGSDATAGAVRVARAYTGREIIASSGYHGWHDWSIGTTTRNLGVPPTVAKLTRTFEYNKLESLRQIFLENPGRVAAVIMEPVGVVPPAPGFLRQVKALARKEGAILIFDEIVTGFRFSLGGAQEYFKVTPDLACFGKALGNGFPISAVVGRREIMKVFDKVFFSFTFGGETIALAAALATLAELKRGKVVPHLWSMGRNLQRGYNDLAKEFGLSNETQCVGFSPRTMLTFSDLGKVGDLTLRSLFIQETAKRGVLSLGLHNVSLGHAFKDVQKTLGVYRQVFQRMKTALESGRPASFLEGPPVQPVFRRP